MRTHDGLQLSVAVYGPDDAPLTVFLAHCWTLNQHDWHCQVRDLLEDIPTHVRGSMLTTAPGAGHMLPLERDHLVSGVLIRLIRPRG